MIRLISTVFVLLSIASVSAFAEDSAKFEPQAVSINQSLADALERDGVARIEVTLDLTGGLAEDAKHPATDSGVHPAVFDIAMMAAQGPMQLDTAGDFHLFRLTATQAALDKCSR